MTSDSFAEARNDTNDLMADYTALREDISKLTATVTELVRNQAASAADNVSGAVDQARQKVADTANRAQERMSSAASELEASIERNPITAVVIALAAGLIVGLFTRAGK
jgi:ElaB/YqjD/DUF883 family membrane-anchored ribosome-binding protein